MIPREKSTAQGATQQDSLGVPCTASSTAGSCVKHPSETEEAPDFSRSSLPDKVIGRIASTESLLDVDGIINSIVNSINMNDLKANKVATVTDALRKIGDIEAVLEEALMQFKSEPSMITFDPPVHIIGDIHGQFSDLMRILDECGPPSSTKYLFLGDYVDRGAHSLEVIMLVLCLKIKYKKSFFLLRGNHEWSLVNNRYGFKDELERRFNNVVVGSTAVWNVKEDDLKGRLLWYKFNEVFKFMPITALVMNKILCMHGGLSPELNSLEDLINIKRPADPFDTVLFADIMWSDPDLEMPNGPSDPQYKPSKVRGAGRQFNANAVKSTCEKLGVELIVRAHQVVQDGTEFFAGRRLITVFSAPNYCGQFNNKGGILHVDAAGTTTIKTIAPLVNCVSKTGEIDVDIDFDESAQHEVLKGRYLGDRLPAPLEDQSISAEPRASPRSSLKYPSVPFDPQMPLGLSDSPQALRRRLSAESVRDAPTVLTTAPMSSKKRPRAPMCGILGLILAEGVPPGALPVMAVDGLTALQHRGTESSGLVGSDGIHRNQMTIQKGTGLVRDVYSNESLMRFKDSVAMVGHNRYSTAGMKDAINCIQPFVVHTAAGLVAVAHNGELVDATKTRNNLLNQGVGLSTDGDSELICQLIAKAIALNMKCRHDGDFGNIQKELAVAMSEVRTSYSLIVMTFDRIYALRDPYGNRPLSIGTLYSNSSMVNGAKREPLGFVAVSESCALPASAKFTCDVKPGEIVEISRQGIRSVVQMTPAKGAFCIFEYVYFARADSILEGQQVHSVRDLCGRILAEEAPIDADIVSTVPESATAASMGYAARSGIPYEQVLHRNSYVGRSFIQPNTELRQSAIHKKFGVLSHNVRGKRIVLVDDSIVRGNTMGIIVRLLKEHGAKEVHIRIASPPVRFPCFMGINIPSTDELVASKLSIEQIRVKFGADSVAYLSVDGLQRAVQTGAQRLANFELGHCAACLTGEYPVDLDF
ncbi:hypothetical protein QR680_012617 [Steinernema hermaphroditum]|uniref:Serine/threonine-protein phosphatase n=1 Tax=Steinernema hermaphroditum TaxID=289476 RepID=A0AA39I5D1_9BILA|nr:hypothetical protein QR680_012617 [Steinernema hermaphroditum]